MISSAPIALDALGAGVPGRDAAVGVEHENRIVDRRRPPGPGTAGRFRAPGIRAELLSDGAMDGKCRSDRSPAIPSAMSNKRCGSSVPKMNRNFDSGATPRPTPDLSQLRRYRPTPPGAPRYNRAREARERRSELARRIGVRPWRSGIVRRDATRSPDRSGSRPRRRRPCACPRAEELRHAAGAGGARDADHARCRNAVFRACCRAMSPDCTVSTNAISIWCGWRGLPARG